MDKFTAQLEDWEVEDPNPQKAISPWFYYKSLIVVALVGSLLIAGNEIAVQGEAITDPTPMFDSKIDRTYVDRRADADRD